MTTYFTSPVAPLVPAAVKPDHPGYSLFKHYRPWDAGTNVWLLTDGTITTNDPADDTVVTRVFHGGHIHEVDDAEAALLTAAGYADNLVEGDAPVHAPGLSGFVDVSSSGEDVDPGF